MWTGVRSLLRVEDREVAADIAMRIRGTVVPRSPWTTSVESGRLALCLCRENRVLRGVAEFRARLPKVDRPVTIVRELGLDTPIEGEAVLRASLRGVEVLRGAHLRSVQCVLPWLSDLGSEARWSTLQVHPLGVRIGYLELSEVLTGDMRARVVGWTSIAGRICDRATGSRSVATRELALV